MPTDADQGVDALLDTSAAVALLVSDHEAHARTFEATRGMRLGLAGHAWFETYSVLTRMPPGIRRRPVDIVDLLQRNFPGQWILDEPATAALEAELAHVHIAGGAVYDALVGAAARHHDVPLLTSDRRAMRTWSAMGVRFQVI